MAEVFNKRHGPDSYPRGAVYIGRPSKWGNPFEIGKDGSRAEVIAKFEAWLRSKPDLMLAAKLELAGRNLLCWCWPLPCHGNVLLRIVNETPEGRRSPPAGALESGSPYAVARDSNPGSAVPGGVECPCEHCASASMCLLNGVCLHASNRRADRTGA